MVDESVVAQHNNTWVLLTLQTRTCMPQEMFGFSQDFILHRVHSDQLAPTRNLHWSNLVKGISRLVI